MSAYQLFLDRFRDLQALDAAGGLMSWDQQVLMPAGGTPARSAHLSAISRMRHQLLVSDETRRLVENAEKEAESPEQIAGLRAFRRELDSKTKLPISLVERKTRVSSDAYEVWKRAKVEDDFAAMRPYYEELYDIARETSQLLDPDAKHIYDPLLDLYEEGAKYEDAAGMFEAIKEPIFSLVKEIAGQPQIDDSPIAQDFDRPTLRALMQDVTSKIGFDFSRGRLDLAPNAFCGGSNPGDIRMTTRASNHLRGVVSSSLHEMGHGLYEQGQRSEWARTPVCGGISLAVHESQSRLWENIVGRSRGFWHFFGPRLSSTFRELSSHSPDDLWRMMNKIEPTFIRVGSDELTYNMHILVRFELEVEILTGAVAVKDLPEAWNAKYQAYLGITPPNDGLGCLQDVHWSRGSVGYFSTYAMGNLIGGAIWKVLLSELGDVEEEFARGEFGRVLEWLQKKVYRQGKLLQPRDLIQSITGGYLNPQPWLEYASAKYRSLYGLSS